MVGYPIGGDTVSSCSTLKPTSGAGSLDALAGARAARHAGMASDGWRCMPCLVRSAALTSVPPLLNWLLLWLSCLQISVTSGVVSRIEVTAYAHGATELLGVQIDAAINSGNSGGWVAEGWRVDGLTLAAVASKAPRQHCSTVCLNRNVVPVAPHAWLPPVYSRWGCRRVQSLPPGWALKGSPPGVLLPLPASHKHANSLRPFLTAIPAMQPRVQRTGRGGGHRIPVVRGQRRRKHRLRHPHAWCVVCQARQCARGLSNPGPV